ncbi:MAG: MFS transporter, partial [Pseudomonadota bacterium]
SPKSTLPHKPNPGWPKSANDSIAAAIQAIKTTSRRPNLSTIIPQMLVFLGEAPLKAAAIISIGSWLLVFSGAICGMIVDRFGRRDVVLMACIAAAILSLALLGQPGLGLWGSVLFGLMGVAPAGVIMALAGEAVAPERRAFGMGVFFSLYYALMTAAPPVAGAILDATGQPFAPLIFGMALFALVLFATFGFRVIQRRPAPANPANP